MKTSEVNWADVRVSRPSSQEGLKSIVTSKLIAVYTITSSPASIEARAQSIAVEQSVEMPVAAIEDTRVLGEVVGEVSGISNRGDGRFDVRIALDVETTGFEAGQLLNVLFGNSSIHDDVVLSDVIVPPVMSAAFAGPNVGAQGLRERVGARDRALTCSALKPQGLSAQGFGALAGKLAQGGLDYIKDDHALADQRSAPFAERVAAVAAAVREANAQTGRSTRYLPNVSGHLDTLRAQVAIARENGLDTLLIAPMIVGFASFECIVRENRDFAFIAHPAMAGAARIAPAALFGRLFRMLGADGLIYPNHGGRFGYSPGTCRAISETALAPWTGIKPALPVPAGGMQLANLESILRFYGRDAMLLIGGDLLMARESMTQHAQAFQRSVEAFDYGACKASSIEMALP